MPVLLKMRKGAARRIDGEMRKVRRTKALQLGVEIGEVAALEQRVVRKVDARYDVLSAKGDLLGFGKEIVDEPVEHEPTDDADRRQLFGYDLRRIEHVERKALRELTVEELHAQFPFGKIAGLDRIPEIAAVKVGIGAIDLDGLVPDDRLQAQLGLPVEFDKGRVACCVEQPEGVNAEAFHCAKRARDCPIGHDPHDHVHRFRGQADEIPEIVVRGLSLRKSAIRLWLSGMDDVGKLDRVLDEEDRDVVTDNVPIAFLCVKFDREAAHIAREIGRALGAGDGREADKGLGLLADALKDVGPRHIGEAFGQFEITVRSVAAGMHNTLGDTLMVEVEDLLPEMEILQHARPALPCPQGVLVIGDHDALLGGQPGVSPDAT